VEPISLIVTALAAGAAAAAKPVATKAVTDAYAGLKRIIQDRYAAARESVEHLEKAPDKQPRRDGVAEELATTKAATDTELMQQAQSVIDAVEADDPEVARTFGLRLKGFTAKELTAEDIETHATTGPATGADMKDTHIDGAAVFKGFRTTSGADVPKHQGQ
jgi:hypothetical protein